MDVNTNLEAEQGFLPKMASICNFDVRQKRHSHSLLVQLLLQIESLLFCAEQRNFRK